MATVLVVDDYEDTRGVVLRLLKFEGYQGVGVASGTEALEFLAGSTPALILLDYRMPDLNGLEVFHQMKRDPRLAAIPVVMMSADDPQLKEDALAAGIKAYIAKGSLDWLRLREVIRQLIGPGIAPPANGTAVPPSHGSSATRGIA